MHSFFSALEGKAFFEILGQSKSAVAVFTGPDFKIQLINEAMLSIWRKDRSVYGRKFEEVLPEINGCPFIDRLKDVWNTSITHETYEAPVTLEINGTMVTSYFDFMYQPIFDTEGKVYCILNTATDVTNRVRAIQTIVEKEDCEEQIDNKIASASEKFQSKNKELYEVNEKLTRIDTQLMESHERFRNLILQAPVAMMLLKGENLIVTMINKQMLEIIDRDASIIGKSLLEVIPELKGQKAGNMLIETVKEGKTITDYSNPVILNRNGYPEKRFFNFTYTPYLENGKVTGVIDIAVEVTKQELAIQEREKTIIEKTTLEKILRENEQRLTSILETMAEGVGIIDLNGQLVYANLMAQQILGLAEGTIKGRTYDDPKWQNLRLDGSPLPSEEHPMSIMLQTKKPVYDHEICVQPPDRERFYISINAAPMFDEEDNLTGGIGTFMDVTSRRKIMQGKEDFISIASHELRTPVTGLKASLQLLRRSHHKMPEETRTKLLSHAIQSLDKLSALISDLLDTSRIEQGQLTMQKQAISFSQLFDECCSDLINANGPEIIFEGDTSQIIEADKQQIGQVVVNFLNNATKYAPNSEKIIVRVSSPKKEKIKVSVIDQGPGISAEKLAHLFKRYYRAEYLGQRFTGLGLGLYISAEIIKNHGGETGVQSTENGSEFWFTLPYLDKKQ